MSISSYTELQTAIANWLARDDLTARIPEFITLAEAKMNRVLKIRQLEERSSASVVVANDEPEFISLPDNFQSMRRIRLSSVTGKPRLSFMTAAQLDEYRYGTQDTAGQPLFFTVFGDEIELCPTPNNDMTIEMVYRTNVTPLSNTNTTTDLLTMAPDLYLYGTLLEATPYMKEDERLATWATAFSAVVDQLNSLSMESSYGAGPMQVRVSGQVV